MCWAHMRRKLVKKIESMVGKMEQEDLIEASQLAQNERMLTKTSNVFIKKWNKKETKFIEYFQNEWLNSHDAWYEGIKLYSIDKAAVARSLDCYTLFLLILIYPLLRYGLYMILFQQYLYFKTQYYTIFISCSPTHNLLSLAVCIN
jgi:hypothetical protein